MTKRTVSIGVVLGILILAIGCSDDAGGDSGNVGSSGGRPYSSGSSSIYYPDLQDAGSGWGYFSPAVVVPGDYFLAGCAVINGGNEVAGGFWVHFCASTNSIISRSDFEMGSVWVGGHTLESFG